MSARGGEDLTAVAARAARAGRGRSLPRPPGGRFRIPDALSGVVALFVVWSAVSILGMVPQRTLPPPHAILGRVVADLRSGELLSAAVQTSLGWGLGLGVGLLAGLVWGWLLAESPYLYALFRPYLAFFNSMPRVILAPFAILLFGLGAASKVAISVSLVLFTVTLGAYGALRSVPVELLQSVEMMGAPRRNVLLHVTLPGAVPYFLGTLRVAVSLALLGVIVGEILLSTDGIGRLIALRGLGFDVEGVFSALVALGVLAALGNTVINVLSRRLLRWQAA